MYTCLQQKPRHWLLAFVLLWLAILSPVFVARAVWDGQYYDPGETLNPECAPTDVNCDVNPVTNAAHGGTGLSSYAAGDLLYAASSSTLGKLALGVDGKVLKVVGGVLAWADDSTGTAFTADGSGIELSGSTFGLELDGTTLTKSASGLRVSASYAGQNTITTLGTITTGTWNGTAIGDAYLTKNGDWIGTLDGVEGAAFLARANHTGTQTASTISDFSTAVASLLSTGNGLVVNGTSFGLVLDGNTLTKSIDGLRVSSAYTTNWDAAFSWGDHASAGYAKLLGQAGGQTLIGGTASGQTLTLQSTSNATKGKILFGTSGYDEVNNRLGIGTATPLAASDVRSAITDFNVMKTVQAIHSANQGPYIASFFNDTFSTTNPVMAYYGFDNGNFSLGTFSGKLFFGAGGTYSGGSTTRMTIDNTTGSIGIGTITPTETFQIADSRTSPNSTGMYLQKNGAVSSGVSYGLNIDTTGASLSNIGAYISARGATNNRSIWVPSNNTAGSTNYALYIESAAQNYFAGNVGIGTITSTHKLDITGGSLASVQRAISVTGTLSSTAARQAGIQGAFTTSAGNTNENDGIFVQLLPGNVSSAFNIAGMFANTVAGTGTSVIGGTANYGAYGDVNSTTAGTNIGVYGQSAGGNVSIGTSGNSVVAKDSATNIGVLGLGKNTGTSGIQLGGYFGLSSSAPTFASGALMADNSSTTSPIFVARDNGSEVFRIDDGGKVGIGITPTQSLETTGSIIGGQGFSMGKGLANTSLGFGFGRNFTTGSMFDSNRYGFQFTRAGNADRLDLEVYNGSGTLITGNAISVDSVGNFGVGTNSPGSYKQRVLATRQGSSGDLAIVSLENAGTSSADVLTLKQTGEAGSAESQFVTFYTNAGLIGSIASNGSGVTSYNTTSDRRLKDSIAETEYGIDDVLKIPVRQYTMRQDPKGIKQTGFIAQELAAIYPDAVSANGDDGISPLDGKTPWSIDYGRLTPLLVKSIQDQQVLLGDITNVEGLEFSASETRNESPLNAFDYMSAKLEQAWRPLRNIAALRMTAIRGYFDEMFVRKSHQEEICVGTDGNETCLNKAQLDSLLLHKPSPNPAPENNVVEEAVPSEN